MSEEVRKLADEIASLSGRLSLEADRVACIKAATALRLAAQSAAPVGETDALDDLVARFSNALLKKLKLSQANGRSGWELNDWETDCQRGLLRHVEKGDPRDVAAYCAFMWHHGWTTAAPAPSAAQWQPISTAPRDGSPILVCDATYQGDFQVVYYDETISGDPTYVWRVPDGDLYHEDAFTHWHPIPAHPGEQKPPSQTYATFGSDRVSMRSEKV